MFKLLLINGHGNAYTERYAQAGLIYDLRIYDLRLITVLRDLLAELVENVLTALDVGEQATSCRHVDIHIGNLLLLAHLLFIVLGLCLTLLAIHLLLALLGHTGLLGSDRGHRHAEVQGLHPLLRW